MWGYVAAAALPYLVGALQKKPKAPVMARPVDRSAYINQLLQMAMNPNSQQFKMASDVAQEQVNRALARQGLAGSSIGGQISANIQAKLANDFMNEQISRLGNALGIAQNQDQMGMQGNVAVYNAQRQAYEDALKRQAAVAQGVGNVVNAGYAGYQADQYGLQRDKDRAAMLAMYSGNNPNIAGYQPTYGVPGPQPMGAATPQQGYGFNYNSPYYNGSY